MTHPFNPSAQAGSAAGVEVPLTPHMAVQAVYAYFRHDLERLERRWPASSGLPKDEVKGVIKHLQHFESVVYNELKASGHHTIRSYDLGAKPPSPIGLLIKRIISNEHKVIDITQAKLRLEDPKAKRGAALEAVGFIESSQTLIDFYNSGKLPTVASLVNDGSQARRENYAATPQRIAFGKFDGRPAPAQDKTQRYSPTWSEKHRVDRYVVSTVEPGYVPAHRITTGALSPPSQVSTGPQISGIVQVPASTGRQISGTVQVPGPASPQGAPQPVQPWSAAAAGTSSASRPGGSQPGAAQPPGTSAASQGPPSPYPHPPGRAPASAAGAPGQTR